jgi:hypothetical protein
MVTAIDHNQPSPTPNFEDGLWSQRMLDAARLSSENRAWVEF